MDNKDAHIAALEAELERERIRLAACGVVARANTRDSAAKMRQMSQEYRSASLDDVERAVDREIAERERREDAEAILQNVLNCCEQHWIALDIDDHFARYKD